MPTPWITPLDQITRDDRDRVGAKCANLGELLRLGMRVPPGFAISAASHARFLEQTGMGPDVRATLDAAGEDLVLDVEQQRQISRSIRRRMRSLEMPAELAEAIGQAYRGLCEQCGLVNGPVAVRSSGAVSMPGQMDTYLNVRGEREVLGKVTDVWSSAYSWRAVAYRARRNMPMESEPIGVAVLQLVDARSAGVLLTALPNTGDRSCCVVEGSWGLGEGLVSGELTPDHFVVDKQTGAVESTIANKTQQVVCLSSGTTLAEVPLAYRQRPCLEARELAELVRVGKVLEEHFGEPQDAEWVIGRSGGFPENLYWVQTRSAGMARGGQAESEYLAELMTRVFRM